MLPRNFQQSWLEIRRLGDKGVVKKEGGLPFERRYASFPVLRMKLEASVLHSLGPVPVVIFVIIRGVLHFCR